MPEATEVQPSLRPTGFVEPLPMMADSQPVEFISRLFGGFGWLLVSFGTFFVAFGWLGVFDAYSSYYDDPIGSFRLIGYGIVVYAIAAIAFSIREFIKPLR